MEKKRKAYKTQEKCNEAMRRYRATEEGKLKAKITVAKSQTKKFIIEFSTLEDLEMIEELIRNRKGEITMEKEIIKNLVELSIEEINDLYDIFNLDESIINEANKELAETKGINIDGLDEIDQVVLLYTLKDITNSKNFLRNLKYEVYEDLKLMQGHSKELEKLYNESKDNTNEDIIIFYKKAVKL